MRPQRGKQKLLDAATKLFETKGYFATTVEQITEEAGVSKGLVYNYFNSKEELLVALLESATDRMKLVAGTAMVGDSIEKSLSRLLDQLFDYLQTEKRFLKLQLTLMLMPELQQVVKESQEKRATQLLEILSGWFRRADVAQPEDKARVFLAMVDGVALHYLFIYPQYPLTEMKAHLMAAAGNLCRVVESE